LTAPGVVEWWVARPYGAQQAWRLDRRPEGAGELVLDVEIGGARVIAEQDVAVLIPEIGPKLHYRDLVARDADGRQLPARFDTDGASLSIHVDDTDAAWPIVIDPVLTSGYLRIAPAGLKAEFGIAVAAGNVNGDAYVDFVATSRGLPLQGAAYIFHGRAGGTYLTTPTTTIVAAGAYACDYHKFGEFVDLADFSGDGRDDLLYNITSPACVGQGQVDVHLGGVGGVSASAYRSWTTAYGDNGVVSSLGDVNNDGYNDLAFIDAGAIKIVHGASGGPGAAIARTIPAPAGGKYVVAYGAGDINNDGYDDMVAGYPYVGSGGAQLFKGSSTGIPASASQTLSVPSGASRYGLAANGVGDVNNDGRADVIIGDPGYSGSSGRAFLHYGTSTNLSTSPVTLDATGSALSEGNFAFGVGDLSGDGPDDFVVFGADGTLGGNSLWEGTNGGVKSTPSNTAFAGYHTADAMGDIDGDGFGDFITSQFGNNEVFIHYGCVDHDGDGVCADGGDCDDNNAARRPGATEIVGNGVDEDCNNQEICFDDDDNDGYLDTSGDTRVSTDADCLDANEGTNTDLTTDCDDAVAARNPGATEITGNGVDENCDGQEICFDDDDNDGYLDTSGDTRVSTDADCLDANEG
ncbi:MAG TPA: FG-GAP-like repeat-containing protein, partial [Myxococcota bacterium]|nr:FG-GAP-like repeat-containing protein [Myxococcota bacterium]